jgi:hypothetical protein
MFVEDPGGELAPLNELLQVGASAGAGSGSQQGPAGTKCVFESPIKA